MALFARCWLLIECFVIPHGHGHGFSKWFYLSFHIQPFFLPFCLIYLCLHRLLLLLCFPLRIICCMLLFVTRSAALFISRITFRVEQVFYDAMEEEIISACELVATLPAPVDCPDSELQLGAVLYTDKYNSVQERDPDCSHKPGVATDMEIFDLVQERDKDGCMNELNASWLHEYLYSERYVDPYQFSYGPDDDSLESLFSSDDEATMGQSQDDRDSEISLSECSYDRQLLPICNFHVPTDDDDDDDDDGGCSSSEAKDWHTEHKDFTFREIEHRLTSKNVQENNDSFHQQLTERFRFFNLLYHERLYGLSEYRLNHPG